jgi:hypothetical protein
MPALKRAKCAQSSASRLTQCPVCDKPIALANASVHVELCLSASLPKLLRQPAAAHLPPGLSVVPEFITAEEEEVLLGFLDLGEWKPSSLAACDSVGYGLCTDYALRQMRPASNPIPAEFNFIIQRFRERVELAAWCVRACDVVRGAHIRTRGQVSQRVQRQLLHEKQGPLSEAALRRPETCGRDHRQRRECARPAMAPAHAPGTTRVCSPTPP